MSQAEVASALGKSRAWVSLYEEGRIQRISEGDRDTISRLVGLDEPAAGRRPLVTMPEDELEEMLVRAAEMGATLALRRGRRS